MTLILENIQLKRDRRTLISNLSAHFYAGSLIHIQGENGIGKTSLLRCLAGLSLPDSGNILYKKQNINDLLYTYHQKIVYLGHYLGLKEDLNARENLNTLLRIRGNLTPQIALNQMIDHILTQFGLANIHRPLRQLSAGQRRRVGLARLPLENSPIWLLDEPFTALDHKTISFLEELIKNHCIKGGLVIMTSHQPLSEQLNATPLILTKVEKPNAIYNQMELK